MSISRVVIHAVALVINIIVNLFILVIRRCRSAGTPGGLDSSCQTWFVTLYLQML